MKKPPSRFFVSMKHSFFALLVFITKQSAGKYESYST